MIYASALHDTSSVPPASLVSHAKPDALGAPPMSSKSERTQIQVVLKCQFELFGRMIVVECILREDEHGGNVVEGREDRARYRCLRISLHLRMMTCQSSRARASGTKGHTLPDADPPAMPMTYASIFLPSGPLYISKASEGDDRAGIETATVGCVRACFCPRQVQLHLLKWACEVG